MRKTFIIFMIFILIILSGCQKEPSEMYYGDTFYKGDYTNLVVVERLEIDEVEHTLYLVLLDKYTNQYYLYYEFGYRSGMVMIEGASKHNVDTSEDN